MGQSDGQKTEGSLRIVCTCFGKIPVREGNVLGWTTSEENEKEVEEEKDIKLNKQFRE
jgi:hypothetical protein